MNERELFVYLKDVIEDLPKEVTADFIIERDIKKTEFEIADSRRSFDNSRTDKQRTMNADCIFLEYLMIQSKKVLEPTNKLHDYLIDGYAVDNKDVQTPYFYPTVQNESWVNDGIKSKLLTHYLFNKMDRPDHTMPLVVGDKVGFSHIKLVPAKMIGDNLKQYIKKNGQLGKRYFV